MGPNTDSIAKSDKGSQGAGDIALCFVIDDAKAVKKVIGDDSISKIKRVAHFAVVRLFIFVGTGDKLIRIVYQENGDDHGYAFGADGIVVPVLTVIQESGDEYNENV